VLCAPCDAPDLPTDLFLQLSPRGLPAYVADHPVIGLWPCTLAERLLSHLERNADRSLRAWVRATGATPIELTRSLRNINTPDDLAALRQERHP
jgi:molybdopterin-guanine dinucleotide biosynthesis protein A